MNWSIAGWVMIGLSAILLVIFSFLVKKNKLYEIKKSASVDGLISAQTKAIERGQPRLISLGDQYWSRTYPGLGLHALTILPTLTEPENVLDGELTISGGEGGLVALACQIVQKDYSNGFSLALSKPGVNAILPGPTPFSYSIGLLSEIELWHYGSISLFGNYGPEAILLTEAIQSKGGHVFAGAGSLPSQASLLLSVQDLMIGESIYSASGLLNPSRSAISWIMTEDLMRFLLILSLAAGVILKLVGVL